MLSRIRLIVFLLLSIKGFSQSIERKSLTVFKTDQPIKIDGEDKEQVWMECTLATNFIEFEQNNGFPEPENLKTEVKVVYNETSLFVFAKLLDDQPELIMRQLSARDQPAVSDYFKIVLNPYNDGQQEFVFLVTAAGVQYDAFSSAVRGEDASWDAVWKSAVKVTNYGWKVEMEIPFSALRFSKEIRDAWGVNFWREVRRERKTFSWNFVDRRQNTPLLYHGELKGLTIEHTPTRLFFIPYASTYFTKKPDGETKKEIRGGADVKWGINDAFTLDAILIPDFGQVAFDNVELVLGPFEQQFAERRLFFTEGADLFSKGGLLYTRRIGEVPRLKVPLDAGEFISYRPNEAAILNALKISGRTRKGLGVGVLNAITDEVKGIATQSLDNSSRELVIAPLTNYNVTTIDQRFGVNNSISLVHTNVLRSGAAFRDAHVTALLLDFVDKSATYRYFWEGKYSWRNEPNNLMEGFWMGGSFSKIKGKNRFGLTGRWVSRDFNINDLGINFLTNYHQYSANYSYRILQANEKFNSFQFNASTTARINLLNNYLETWNYSFSVNTTNKANDFLGAGISAQPFRTYNFYEPRVFGLFLPQFRELNFWIYKSPNYNRVFLIDWNPSVYFREREGMWGYSLMISPRWRVSDHLSLIAIWNGSKNHRDLGWVDFVNPQTPVIGMRDQWVMETQLRTEYNVNPLMSFYLNLRHYWSNATYEKFYQLHPDGILVENPLYAQNQDLNYNNWVMDIGMSWWFLPGSQMVFLYRNSTTNFSTNRVSSVFENWDNLFQMPLQHIISLRVSYFFDINYLRKK